MRTYLICSLVLFALLGLTSVTQAEDKADDEVAKAMSKIAQLGPGVHAIKKDNKGRITSCVVVGQSRISTVLGKAKGLETARDRAKLDASGQFVKWLNEKVSIYQKSEDESILFIEGSEDNDKEALKESGKAVEKTTKKIESLSQGLIRGFQVLHVEVSDKDKSYTIVLGWDAKTARAVQGVKEANGPGSKTGGDPKQFLPDKKIEDKKVTSPDAKKFLP